MFIKSSLPLCLVKQDTVPIIFVATAPALVANFAFRLTSPSIPSDSPVLQATGLVCFSWRCMNCKKGTWQLKPQITLLTCNHKQSIIECFYLIGRCFGAQIHSFKTLALFLYYHDLTPSLCVPKDGWQALLLCWCIPEAHSCSSHVDREPCKIRYAQGVTCLQALLAHVFYGITAMYFSLSLCGSFMTCLSGSFTWNMHS